MYDLKLGLIQWPDGSQNEEHLTTIDGVKNVVLSHRGIQFVAPLQPPNFAEIPYPNAIDTAPAERTIKTMPEVVPVTVEEVEPLEEHEHNRP